MDALVAQSLGCTAAGEALAKGEVAFRTAEASCLATLLRSNNQIISAGGGTPTAPGAAALILTARDSGKLGVIYLRAEPTELQQRMRADTTLRPSLTGANPVDEVPNIFTKRDALYQELADMTIDVDRLSTEQVAIRAEKCVHVLIRGSNANG